MKTPAQIKEWLSRPGRPAKDNGIRRDALAYIRSLENIVAGYTARDGKLEDGNGHGLIRKTQTDPRYADRQSGEDGEKWAPQRDIDGLKFAIKCTDRRLERLAAAEYDENIANIQPLGGK